MKKMTRSITLGLRATSVLMAAWLAGAAEPADSATISFAGLSQPGNGLVSVGGSVAASGFTLTSGDGAFDVWGASSANLPSLNTADTSLFEFFAGATTTLTRGAGHFDLSSIDLAPVIAGGAATFTVTFTGTHPDNSIVSQTFTVSDSTPTLLTTFNFAGFTDLKRVTFQQGTNIGFFMTQDTAYQFDNVVASAVPTGVPEPASLAVLAAGGAMLTLLRRRRAGAA